MTTNFKKTFGELGKSIGKTLDENVELLAKGLNQSEEDLKQAFEEFCKTAKSDLDFIFESLQESAKEKKSDKKSK